MTNFERIKCMAIDEMAELLNSGLIHASCNACAYFDSNNCRMRCVEGRQAWLEQEAEE